jgi:NAD(P)-dependent dehydrogenase (short-subunit alcohol dehydrogenase family)
MRTALITGASKGIGAATALRFAQEKANLILHFSSDRQGAETVAAQAQVSGSKVTLIQADLTTLAGVQAFCEQLKEHSVDVLVNNAGSLIGRHKIPEMPASHWEATVMLNLSSVFYITQAVVPHMLARKSGWIVNVGSVAGRNGGGPGAIAYATCKGAVSAMTKSMAKELAPSGIHVNCVAPGVIATNFHEVFSTPQMLESFKANTPAGRLGTSEETADVIEYLCSDKAAYIYGQTIEVNGGLYFA